MATKAKKQKSKKSKTIIKIVVIIGVLIIPLLYSYFYLGAFWDPYARLDDVPVAVVNLDEGATINDEKHNVGDEICDNLKDDGSLKFDFTDIDTAEAGVKGSDYYAEIIIPKDFSKNISKASKDTKKVTGTITYKANQKRNYLAAQILENAMPTIKETITSNVDEEIVCTLTDKLYEVPDSLEKLKDGLGLIFDGSDTLKDGTSTLSTATITLKDGTSKLNDGAKSLTSGLSVFKNGTKTLADATVKLDTGATSLLDGTKTLKAGTGELASKIPALTSGVTAINNGAKQVNDGSATLSSGSAKFDSSLNTYASGVSTAADGSSKILGGVTTISSGIDKLLAGVQNMESQVASGSTDLSDGVDQLVAGGNSLNTNLVTYTSGVKSLIASYESAVTLMTQSAPYISDATTQQKVIGYLNSINTPENQALLAKLKNSGDLLVAGSNQINDGLAQLKTSSSTSMTTLYKGLQQVEAGLKSAQTGVGILSDSTDKLQSGLNTLKSNNTALLGASSQIKSGAASLSTGASTLYSGTSTLAQSAGALANGVTELDNGASTLLMGVTTLKDGTAQVADGAGKIDANTTTIKDGAKTLSDGIKALDNGTTKLKSGASDLNNGAAELKDGVGTANSEVSEKLDDTNDQLGALDGLSDYAATPVNTDTQYDYPVANYGSAFAPYFMSLSMWVGGLMIFFGIYLDYEKKIKVLSKSSDHVVLRAFVFMGLGIAQAVLLAFVIKHILGIDVANTGMLYLGCCVVSLSFISIIQFCLVHLGDAGKFVSLLLLILQLTSCAGTFPIETVPTLFQKLYPFMPMTYSVELFKEALSGEWNGTATKCFIILISIMVVFTLITTILSAVRDRQRIKALLESTQAA